MRAFIVVDLGFGDSGKGLLTDFLVRQKQAGVVVRYNGGAQAAHNVVTPDGRHHTFSQFGAGTFLPGVKTYLSRHVVIHPTALLVEGDMLASKGVVDPFGRLRISEQALVITPFHQAANQFRETLRGDERHGSCGVGVGETVEDALTNPSLSIVTRDLYDFVTLRRKLLAIRAYKRDQLAAWMKETQTPTLPPAMQRVFEDDTVIDGWVSATRKVAELGLVVSDMLLQRWLGETDCAVFEGAQGVLLDAEAGFHPYTTWSRSTAENALSLLREYQPHAQSFQIGVLRAYAMRHGPGPLPTEADELRALVSEHNQHNAWQGDVRYGWFDAVLARYALQVAGVPDALLVTHMDVLPKLPSWKYSSGYQHVGPVFRSLAQSMFINDRLSQFHFPVPLDLARREQFTHELSTTTPFLEECPADEVTVVETLQTLIGQAVGLISTGPTHKHIRTLDALPD